MAKEIKNEIVGTFCEVCRQPLCICHKRISKEIMEKDFKDAINSIHHGYNNGSKECFQLAQEMCDIENKEMEDCMDEYVLTIHSLRKELHQLKSTDKKFTLREARKIYDAGHSAGYVEGKHDDMESLDEFDQVIQSLTPTDKGVNKCSCWKCSGYDKDPYETNE